MGLNSILIFIVVCFLQIAKANSQELIETKRVDSIAIFFKSGSAEVDNSQKLVSRLNSVKVSSGKVRIVSFTDTVGSLLANQKLAAKRLSAISKIVRSSNLKNFIFDSINKNELHNGRRLSDSSFRRVDILVYSVENKFSLGTPINLNINFESGTDVIVPSSTANLETLLSILKKDSTLQIQLNGHVCCQPKHELSVSRAERVKKYLVSKGIKSSRITCKGFSNTVPLVSEARIEDRPKNMRVEVIFRKI